MPFLAGFLQTVFGTLLAWFAQHMTKKVAMGATVASVYLALTLALYASIKALVVFTIGSIENEWLLMGFWALWPGNADACIAICWAADIVVFTYRYHVETVKLVSYIT